jgi:hypothetical protein
MRALITPMRFHGKSLEQSQIRTAESIWADVVVGQTNVTALGRHSDVASARPGDGSREDLLPPLYDVRLSHMATNGFVLAGLELVGSIAYAQAWWCRPER